MCLGEISATWDVRLPANSIDQVQWKAPEIAATVDRRAVANPEQVRKPLAGVGRQGRTAIN
jgi:hypothetical protein